MAHWHMGPWGPNYSPGPILELGPGPIFASGPGPIWTPLHLLRHPRTPEENRGTAPDAFKDNGLLFLMWGNSYSGGWSGKPDQAWPNQAPLLVYGPVEEQEHDSWKLASQRRAA